VTFRIFLKTGANMTLPVSLDCFCKSHVEHWAFISTMTALARRLGISQPAVSIAVRRGEIMAVEKTIGSGLSLMVP
jgi:hypothetical protein